MNIYRTSFKAMGGDNEIVAAAASQQAAADAMEAAVREVMRVETKYSRYRRDAGSITFRINSAAATGGFVACDDETTRLLDIAEDLFVLSGGLFDITSGVLRKAWDFSKPALPDASTLKPLLALVGWRKIERHDNSVRLPVPGMEIDFGGFGKEYAADCAASVLARRGIAHGYVNLGGDIRGVGGQPSGKPWLIGVQDPRSKGAVIATIPVTRGAVATSGDAQKYFEIGGRRYCHILNPLTGFPVDFWRSASVSGPTAMLAGSCSTIAMLKERDAPEFLAHAGCNGLLVDKAGQIHFSPPPPQKEQAI